MSVYHEDGVPDIVCSTGAISRWPDATDPAWLQHWCPKITADAFEVMFYDAWYGTSDDVTRMLKNTGVRCVALHAEKSIGPNLAAGEQNARDTALTALAENCRVARQIGAGVVVLHLWGLPDGDARLGQQLDVLPQLIDIAEREGVRLGIETIPCTVNSPLMNIERVLECDSRARVVLDTEFLAMHGELDAALRLDALWSGNRVVHVHVKDFDGVLVDDAGRRRYLHPGEGVIPFDRWFAGLADLGYRGPIALESTVVDASGDVDLLRLNTSIDRLRTLVRKAWTGAV